MTSIAQERAALAMLGQPLRLRSDWGAVRRYTDSRPVAEPAAKQFVHISVTNPGSYRSNDAHARAIEAIGISRFPATGISYNRGIMMDGTRYEFQPIGRRGAHTGEFAGNCTSSGCPNRGDNLTSSNHNVTGRGYVICQNVNDVVSATQLDALAKTMAADRLAGFVRPTARIHGHRCVSDKSCPGDKMWPLMGKLDALVDHYMAHGFQPVPTPTPTFPLEDDDMQLYLLGANAYRATFGDRYLGVSKDQADLWVKAGVKPLPITAGYDAILREILTAEGDFDEPAPPV